MTALGQWNGLTAAQVATVPVFTVGCQRSGTTMLIKVLDRSPHIEVFGEDSQAAFNEGVRVRSESVLRSLVRKSRAPIVVCKPLNDTQHTDKLLAIDPAAKAIWPYRHFRDVVNSLVEKWGDTQVSAVRQIATGSYVGPGARALGERVSAENLRLSKQFNQKGLSANDAAAFIWYLRNSIYFDLQLDADSAVLLCKYEDLVIDPAKYFQRIFTFIDGEFSPHFIAKVKASSVNKSDTPEIDAEINALCLALLGRIDAQYQRQIKHEQTEALQQHS